MECLEIKWFCFTSIQIINIDMNLRNKKMLKYKGKNRRTGMEDVDDEVSEREKISVKEVSREGRESD